MDQIKVTALRDFAINHLPRAQRTLSQANTRGPLDVSYALAGDAALTGTTAPAIEQAAAHLLQPVSALLIDRHGGTTLSQNERTTLEGIALNRAELLCELTGFTIPWLANAVAARGKAMPDDPAPPNHSTVQQQQPPTLPLLTPGKLMKTAEVAKYIGYSANTLRKWKSNGELPDGLETRGHGPNLRWPSDGVIYVLKNGVKRQGKVLRRNE